MPGSDDRKYPPGTSINDDVSNSSDDETTQLLRARSLGGPEAYTQVYNFPAPQEHAIPIEYVAKERHTQHSIITIFSMWNTMMGTSMLSLPWAIKQAGFVNGLVLLVVVAGIMAYTSYRVLAASRAMTAGLAEFSDVVKVYLGRIAEILTLICSLLTLLGGSIIYWILMSNFLYHIGMFIYGHTTKTSPKSGWTDDPEIPSYVVCRNQTQELRNDTSTFEKAWSETYTVPFYLAVILGPLISLKSPTFFTKFNSLGTLSVIYLIIFVAVKASQWGINLDLKHTSSTSYSSAFEWSFPALTGIASLAYFLQNCVITIARNQRKPENNARDLIIAYVLVCLTYTYIGGLFYMSFPLSKSCIEDNFLNNIPFLDVMAFVARIGLFFQMTCVLPLLTFVIRSQLLHFLFKSAWPGLLHVLVLNAIIVGLCLVFAVFLPTIGHIISFVGAFCGFSYGIFLPCLVYLVMCYHNKTLSVVKVACHGLLIAVGFANFIAQFLIIGHTH